MFIIEKPENIEAFLLPTIYLLLTPPYIGFFYVYIYL